MKGRTVAILAGGLSMTPEVARKCCESSAFVIAVNNAWELAPRADALFASDPPWWLATPEAVEFCGQKIVCGPGAPACATYVEPKAIGPGSNSALQAAYWAKDSGAAKIALCGVDLRDDELAHFHGLHNRAYVQFGKRERLGNPSAETFRRARLAWADFATCQGVPGTVNCSERSSLECFPKMLLEQALAQ